MNKQPTHLMEWWQVDGPEGTMHFPVGSFSIGEAAEAYEFPQAIDTIRRVVGYGVHDGSLWEVFPEREDAESYIAACCDDESAAYDDYLLSLGSHIDGTEGRDDA